MENNEKKQMTTAKRITNSLIIKTIQGKSSLEESAVQLPHIRSNEAVVSVSHIGQNTVDVESLDSGTLCEGTVLGCDFVGLVESVGRGVTKLREGDLIAGLIPGGEEACHGAYSEYTIADEDLCFKLPPHLDRKEAVTVPLGACLAQLGLFSNSCLRINPKSGPDTTVLIWGGSACVGRFAIQLASLFRIRVIATGRPSTFPLLKSLGASHVLDYEDEGVFDEIANLAPDLEYAYDMVGSSPDAAERLSKRLLKSSGSLCALRYNEYYARGAAPETKVSGATAWRAFLHQHRPTADGLNRSPSVADHELSARLFHSLPQWLADGYIKPNHPRILSGGLQAVEVGFEKDRCEGPLDYKIVYEV